jgi:hypothetical protein
MVDSMRNANRVVWFSLFAVFVFLAFNRNWKFGFYNYHDEIWADKAGYHVFLPATLIYNWDAAKMPPGSDYSTGGGFQLDVWRNGILTKYPPGVAIMRLPFFLAAHAWAVINHAPADGFSPPYHAAAIIAGVAYAFAGLYCIWRVLLLLTNRRVAWLGVAGALLGSNLFYYVVEEPGLSHVYSFSLIAWLVWQLRLFHLSEKPIHVYAAAFAVGMVFCVRPVNLLFLTPFLLSWLLVYGRYIHFRIPVLLNAAALMALPVLPWLLYRLYLQQHSFEPYGEEGFIYWQSPHMLKVLFAPENGFFPMSPFFLLLLPALFILMRKTHGIYRSLALTVAGVFGLITFTYASWWAWGLACGFGHRGYIDFYPLFLLAIMRPLADIWHRPAVRTSLLVFLVLCALIVIPASLHWPYCIEGPYWNWQRLFQIWAGS